jgi:hypothetical protein
MWFGFRKADNSASTSAPDDAGAAPAAGSQPIEAAPPTPAQMQAESDMQMKTGLKRAEVAENIGQHQQAAKWHHTLAAYTRHTNPKASKAHEEAAQLHHQVAIAKQQMGSQKGMHQPDQEAQMNKQISAMSGEARLTSMVANKVFPYQNGTWGH